ncbi:hypothetical protein, conserved [Babesia ovata]|uniref:C3H1-type domain-containing protein n=1 Tax=Babesia ovata TaxID=189622 RepID=A0A2H6KJM2_9APIC|nr:uncharacterized protein BOVATA_046850 [Babesia ovata]GBE63192.1 hypothetical protein, conserved [Babesia ovata]
MSFLHGVLHNIKPKLGQHKDTLDSALNSLNNKNDNGIAKYRAAIAAVEGWVRRYNNEVAASNSKVSQQINLLQVAVKRYEQKTLDVEFSETALSTAVKVEQAEKSINLKVQECQEHAKKFTSALNTTVDTNPLNNAISDLNAKLKDRLENVRRTVEYESGRLGRVKVQEEGEFTRTEQKIKDTLIALQNCVNNKISEDIKKLLDELTKMVQEILKELRNISRDLSQRINELQKWIKDADGIVDGAMSKVSGITNGSVGSVNKDNIEKSVKEINTAFIQGKGYVESLVKSALTAVKTMDDELKQDLHGVRTQISTAVGRITEKVKELGGVINGKNNGEIKTIQALVQYVQAQVGMIKNGKDGGIEGIASKYSTHIVSNLTELDSKVRNVTVKFIHAQAAELERKIKMQLGSLPESVLKTTDAQGWQQRQNLDELKRRISQVTRNVTQNQSQQKIDEGKREIESLRTRILQAINSSNESWKKEIDGELQELQQQITPLRSPTPQLQPDQIKNLILKLQLCFERLSQLCHNVDAYINERTMQRFTEQENRLQDLIGEIESQGSSGTIQSNIQRSLYSTLSNAHSAAQQISSETAIQIKAQSANQLGGHGNGYMAPQAQYLRGSYSPYQQILPVNLDTLLSQFDAEVRKKVTDLITNIGLTDREGSYKELKALERNITSLHANLNNATKNPPPPSPAGLVDTAIAQVGITLEQQLKEASGTVDINGSSGFTNYKLQVKQDNIDTLSDATIDNLEGALPEKIKEIKTYGLQLFETNLGAKEKTEYTALGGFLGEIRENLEALLDTVSRTGKAVKQQLTQLQTMIGKKQHGTTDAAEGTLQKIHDQLAGLQTSLDQGPIKNADYLIKYIDHHSKDIVDQLTRHVKKEVNSAESKLTTHARRQYVDALKFALQQFATKIGNELNGLPDKIAADLDQGHKKFMKTFHEHFLNKLKEISGVVPTDFTKQKSPLSEAAKILDAASSSFFNALKIQDDFTEDFPKIEPSTTALHTLLTDLGKSRYFDPNFFTNLDKLIESLSAFNPTKYGEGQLSSILNALRAGFTPLADQLRKQYTNVYEGAAPIKEWVTTEKDKVPAENASPKTKLTDDGERGAKVLLTITSTLFRDLFTLRRGLGESGWNGYKMYNSETPRNSLHRAIFTKHGYDLGLPKNAERGELNYKADFKGDEIRTELINKNNILKHISTLHDNIKDYFRACHFTIADKQSVPCNIYQMLFWLSGLRYNSILTPLTKYLETLFLVDDKEDPSGKSIKPISAYPSVFTHNDIEDALYSVCLHSQSALTVILGSGHSNGIYACDFNTNPDKLSYPSSPAQCCDMLVDILRRLFYQLYFLYTQCSQTTEHSGWYNCSYGQGVGGSGWQCNEKQCANQTCPQIADQKANQKCNQHPNCGVKSPLQSFLEDSLPGFLPHTFSKPGCKLTCTVKNHHGIPCVTPMGFSECSIVASHTSKGSRLYHALKEFCGKAESPLTNLCSQLNCLLPTAPKTLGDMFSFYYNFLTAWSTNTEHRSDAFNKAVAKANFGEAYVDLDPSTMFGSPKHSHKEANADLYTLVCTSRNSIVCGPYLHPLNHDISSVFSNKNADKYLSWITYITETFYHLLKALYEECNKTCGTKGSRCYDHSCNKGCPAGQNASSSNHMPLCKSIVHCPSTLPTLCRYGFHFGNAAKLGDPADTTVTKRTCKNFCKALENLLQEGRAFHTPLVALAPVPAAHRRRPPRRPEDTLTPEVTFQPPHRRAVAPRRRTRQGTQQRQSHNASKRSLETLKELCDFANKVNSSPSGECEKLLTNLCSGLQTFLGYNEKSKGYDGTGIVYSDLDRLCDGVMAFLHSVLNDVHAKQPYNVGKNILRDNVLSHFNGNLCSGHNGFKSVIDLVAQGVGRYNREVERSNKKVSDPIIKLQEEMETLKKQVSEILKDHSVAGTMNPKQPVTFTPEQVEKAESLIYDSSMSCIRNADTFGKDMRRALLNIDHLNHDLRTRVNNVRNTIAHERERLDKASTKQWQDMIRMNEAIIDTMNALQKCINEHITADVNTLVNTLREMVRKIRDKLVGIEKDLGNYVSKLENWISEADRIVRESMDVANGLENKSFAWGAKQSIEDVTTRIKDTFGEAEKYVKELVGKALQAVKTMDGELKKDLWKVKNNIKQAIMQLGTKLDGNVKDDLKFLEEGVNTQMKHYVQQLRTKIRGDVGKILRGEDPYSVNGLRGIEKAVWQLYKDFQEKGAFEKKVQGWVGDVLGKDKTVDVLIDAYVESNKRSGYFQQQDQGGIKQNVIKHIRKVIDSKLQSIITGVTAVENSDKAGIATNLTKIKTCIDSFVQELTKSMQSAEFRISAIVQSIAEQYEREGLLTPQSGKGTHDKTLLTSVLNRILKNLLASARHKAADFAWLISDEKKVGGDSSIAKEIDAAKKNAVDLDTYLKKSVEGDGSGKDGGTSSVEKEIKEKLEKEYFKKASTGGGDNNYEIGQGLMSNFHDTHKKLLKGQIASAAGTGGGTGVGSQDVLEEQLKVDSDTADKINIKDTTEKIFTKYKAQVKQDNIDTLNADNMDNLEGALPAKIKEIREFGLQLFEERLGVKGKSEYSHFDGFLGKIRDNLEALLQEMSKAGQKINQQLTQLQTMIGKKQHGTTEAAEGTLQKIHDQLADLQGPVSKALKDADEFIKYVTAAEKHYIEELKRHIKKAAEDACNQLTTHARRQYINSLKALLAAFSDKVGKDLHGLPRDIAGDLETGHKGFMAKLEKYFIKQINNIHNTSPSRSTRMSSQTRSTFSLATSKLKTALVSFAMKLQVQDDFMSDFQKVKASSDALTNLLTNLTTSQHFNHDFSNNLESLEKTFTTFNPKSYGEAKSPLLLNALKNGFSDLVEQLQLAYISKYDGADPINWSDEKNPDKKNCAQILVTILKTLHHNLHELHERCHKTNGQWKEHKISLISKPSVYNPLGAFFRDCGYKVSRTESSYEGELRCHVNMRGGHVFNKLLEKITLTADTNEHLPKCPSVKDTKNNFDLFDLLKCLTSHVAQYYQSCHLGLPKSKKYPCSVRDICVWLAGLPHTAVYKTINGHCKKMLNEQDKATGAFPNKEDTVMKRSLEHLYGNIKTVCKLAPKLLVSIQGHGLGVNHAAYPYACCFENNHGGFYYPGDPSSLLGILKDMCQRLLRAMSFLYQQCRYTAADGNGWRECQYGYRVGSYQWSCDELSDNSNTQPKSQAKCQPNSEPNDQPTCLPKSPLQAHLMDGLPGFMPHKFTAVGCQAMCSTCPKGSLVGQCITPMGFADLATAGSITGRGDDLVDVLSTLCKNGGSVLCELVHALQCISPSPPKGLAEMFSYYCNVMQKSYGSVYGHEVKYKGEIDSAIHLSFPFKNDMWLHQSYQTSKLTDALKALYCSDKEHNGTITDDNHRGLHTLSPNPSDDKTKQCSTNFTCAPYLKALCHDACHTYPQKHKALYLSWLCRLAWTFWDLLDQLLKAFNNISCQTYGCQCKCGFGKHGVTEEDTSQAPKDPKPSCGCTSIVQCKGPMSVFYQYGFTFGMPKELMGSGSKKTCDNFVKQLNRVLTKGYFKELFDEIDEFIWAIRTPFSYLLLAHWSLSLLYLLHIAVVRLDVLRIRSHLRSPSSHRIAAQSLLAAARVKALANVKYFSP